MSSENSVAVAKEKLAKAYELYGKEKEYVFYNIAKSYAELSPDGMTLTIDSNYMNSKTYKYANNIVSAIFSINNYLSLPSSVKAKMENTRSKKYIFYIINILSMLFIIWMCIEVIGILGSDYSCYLNYPYYVAISCINVSKIVIRIESLSFIIYYFCCFVKLVFIVYNLVIAFNTLTNSRRKHYQPFLLIMHILSLIIFDNFSEMKTFMIYYSLVYIIFSICLVFFLFIKKDKKQENINIINHYA